MFSKGMSLANQITEDIFGAREHSLNLELLAVCSMRRLISQCDFWLQGINAYLYGHPSEYSRLLESVCLSWACFLGRNAASFKPQSSFSRKIEAS